MSFPSDDAQQKVCDLRKRKHNVLTAPREHLAANCADDLCNHVTILLSVGKAVVEFASDLHTALCAVESLNDTWNTWSQRLASTETAVLFHFNSCSDLFISFHRVFIVLFFINSGYIRFRHTILFPFSSPLPPFSLLLLHVFTVLQSNV